MLKNKLNKETLASMTYKEIGKNYGVTSSAVKALAKKYNLKKSKFDGLDADAIQELIAAPMGFLTEKYSCVRTTIYNWLKNNGYKRKTSTHILDKETFKKEVQTLRVADIAEKYNLTEGQVRYFARKHNISIRKKTFKENHTCAEIEKLLNKFKSINGVAKELNVGYNTIKKYVNKNKIKNKSRQVNQYTEDGNFIKSYTDMASAAKQLGCSRNLIWLSCEKQIHLAVGYQFRRNIEYGKENIGNAWDFETSNKKVYKPKVKRHGKKINKYDIDGTYLKTYNNKEEIYTEFKKYFPQLNQALSGQLKVVMGYKWKYYEECSEP